MKEMRVYSIKAVAALGLCLSIACAMGSMTFAAEPGPGVENRVDPGESPGESPSPSTGAGDHETLKMLSEYLAQAALNNPELESAFYRWKAALEKIPQVKSLPDPRFTFPYYIQTVETRVGPQEARLALFQTFPFSVTDEELFKQFPENNPQLKRFDYLEARERAGIELAKKDYYPDLTFGIEDIVTGPAVIPNTANSGKDAVIASVTINIPFWWERRRAAVREGEAKLTSTSKGAEALKRMLLSDMELALYDSRCRAPEPRHSETIRHREGE